MFDDRFCWHQIEITSLPKQLKPLPAHLNHYRRTACMSGGFCLNVNCCWLSPAFLHWLMSCSRDNDCHMLLWNLPFTLSPSEERFTNASMGNARLKHYIISDRLRIRAGEIWMNCSAVCVQDLARRDKMSSSCRHIITKIHLTCRFLVIPINRVH